MLQLSPPIHRLVPELLLNIFECIAQDADRNPTLCSLARCCRAWYPLAQLALYSNIVLQGQGLLQFASHCGSADEQIRSFTMQMRRLPIDPYNPTEAERVEKERLQALHHISQRIAKMSNLTSFSLRAYLINVCPALEAISLIIEHLPATCASLEIDIKGTGLEGAVGFPHICPSLRNILPQLQYLRLRLPWICREFCIAPVENEKNSTSVRAPKLEDCTINLSLREPGPYSRGAYTITCISPDDRVVGSSVAHALDSTAPTGILRALEGFCTHNSTLKHLWVIDSQHKPQDPPNTWGAWIRRDFKTKTSRPIPVGNLGGLREDGYMARLPRPNGAIGTEDWVSYTRALEELAEGSTWTEAPSGTRLPKPVMLARGYTLLSPAVTGDTFRASNNLTCTLWENEKMTGQKLLPENPGVLTQIWDLQERTPTGWRRDNYQGSPMVKQ